MRSRVVPSLLATSLEDVEKHLAPWSARCKRVELRADQLDLQQTVAACRLLDGETIVTLRRPEEGGSYPGDEEQRHAQLLAALDAGARYVDVELGTELAQRMLGSHPQRVVLSHHGGSAGGEAIESRIKAMAATPAALLKLVPDADSLDDVWALRDRLATLEEGRWSIFAMGRAGMLGRLMAPHWGAWGSYAAADPQRPTAADQWSARQMIERYAVDTIGDTTQFMLLVGTQVHAKSPSPAMHQEGYRALGLDRRYIALDVNAWSQARRLIDELPAALAVTMPYKAEAAAAATRRDAVSELASASNTLLPLDDGLEARNSDGPAARQLLEDAGWRPEQSTIIVGAGGTAQAIAAALREAGAAPPPFFIKIPERSLI